MFLLYASPPARVRALGQATAATLAYIAAVEAADGAELEGNVLAAVVPFANWRIPLGGACCILGGARTLAGALVPLVGPAPTGVNLVAEDYNRQRIAGNGTNKHINSNYANNATSDSNSHLAIWMDSLPTAGANACLIGARLNDTTEGGQIFHGFSDVFNVRVKSVFGTFHNRLSPGFIGGSRGNSTDSAGVYNSEELTATAASKTTDSTTVFVLARNQGGTPFFHANCGLSMYSIGTAIDLLEFRSRTSALMSALAAALP